MFDFIIVRMNIKFAQGLVQFPLIVGLFKPRAVIFILSLSNFIIYEANYKNFGGFFH